jgi:hypothetical protein
MNKLRWRTPVVTDVTPTLLDQLRALDRGARTAILGIGHLRNRTKRPRHRPKTVDSPLRRDEIAQLVAWLRALYPRKPDKLIIGRVCYFHRVSRSYVYRVLSEVDPERWENMKASAAAFVETVAFTTDWSGTFTTEKTS